MINWPSTVKFIENKYSHWYYNLVEKARSREIPPEYNERHHIIPRSFGGNNSPSNLVTLSAREHYVAHLLLWKMNFADQYHKKMLSAVRFMAQIKTIGSRNYKVNSRIYSKIREDYLKHNSGEGNPFYGKTHSEETKAKFAIYYNDPLTKKRKSELVKGYKNPSKRLDVRIKNSKAQKERLARDRANGTGYFSQESYAKRYKATAGEKNGRAKTYVLTDANNKEYTITGGLDKFCNEHFISIGWCWDFLKNKTTEKFGGWSIKCLSGSTRTCVYKDNEQKFVKEEELNDFLSNGWIIGSKPKKIKRKLSPEEIQASHEKRKQTIAKAKENGVVYSNPLKGKRRDPESVRKGVEKRMAKMKEEGYVNPAKGRKKSPEVIAKILETKRKNGSFRGMPGSTNPMYGKPRTEEVKAKIRATKLANKIAKQIKLDSSLFE